MPQPEDIRNRIEQILAAQRAVIFDGGLATELERRGHDLNDDLWSAKLLLTDPDAIHDVHLVYLQAGANCLITASYQASFEGLASRGLDADRAREVFRLSIDIARRACHSYRSQTDRAFAHEPLVAASIGPYGAYLADGSEYRGDYTVTRAVLRDFHGPRLEAICEGEPDLLAIETIPNVMEAEVLCELLPAITDRLAWLSFCCRDQHCLADGTPLSQAVALTAPVDQVIATGVNCTAPWHVAALTKVAKQLCADKLILAYPNAGQRYDATTRQWQGSPQHADFSQLVQDWHSCGAVLLGGCCQTGPAHIRDIRNGLGLAQ